VTADLVRVVGPEPSGLAEMLGAVIRGNLQQRPHLARLLDGPPGVVRVTASDVGVSVGIELRDGAVRVWKGEDVPADVEVAADSATLATMGSVPRIAGMPNPLKPAGREMIAKVARGDLRVAGAVRHRKLLRRVQGLLRMGDP